jgi:hypothetical protein
LASFNVLYDFVKLSHHRYSKRGRELIPLFLLQPQLFASDFNFIKTGTIFKSLWIWIYLVF